MPTHEKSTPAPVLVAGGTGFIGSIISLGLLAQGRTVIVPSRSAQRLDELSVEAASEPGTLIPLRVAGDDPHREAAGRLRSSGPAIGAVIAALGGWSTGGPLLEMSDDDWAVALQDHLTSHLRAIQAYVPLLVGDDPVHLTLNGAAAIMPMAGSGAISVTGAAQHMLTAVMRAENVPRLVRFHELSLLAAVSGDDRNIDPEGEIAPEAIVRAVLDILRDPGSPAFPSLDGSTAAGAR